MRNIFAIVESFLFPRKRNVLKLNFKGTIQWIQMNFKQKAQQQQQQTKKPEFSGNENISENNQQNQRYRTRDIVSRCKTKEEIFNFYVTIKFSLLDKYKHNKICI